MVVAALAVLVSTSTAGAVSAFNWSMAGSVENISNDDMALLIRDSPTSTNWIHSYENAFGKYKFRLTNSSRLLSILLDSLIRQGKYSNTEIEAYRKALKDVSKPPAPAWPETYDDWRGADKKTFCYINEAGKKYYFINYRYPASEVYNFVISYSDDHNESFYQGTGIADFMSKARQYCITDLKPGSWMDNGLGTGPKPLVNGARDALQNYLLDPAQSSFIDNPIVKWSGEVPTQTQDVECTPTICAGYVGSEPGSGGTGGNGGTSPVEVRFPDGGNYCGLDNLNFFELAIAKMFKPCEDWSTKFAEWRSEVGKKAPFGYLAWVEPVTGLGRYNLSDPGCNTMGVTVPGEIFGQRFPTVDLCNSATTRPIMEALHTVLRPALLIIIIAVVLASIMKQGAE